MNKSWNNPFVGGDRLSFWSLPFSFSVSYLFLERKPFVVKAEASLHLWCGASFILSDAHLHPHPPSHYSSGSSCGEETNSCIYWFTCLCVSPVQARKISLRGSPTKVSTELPSRVWFKTPKHVGWSDKWWAGDQYLPKNKRVERSGTCVSLFAPFACLN